MQNKELLPCFLNFFQKFPTQQVAMSQIFCNFAADLRVMCTHTRITQHNV